jgi:hypothetical protein
MAVNIDLIILLITAYCSKMMPVKQIRGNSLGIVVL